MCCNEYMITLDYVEYMFSVCINLSTYL